MSVESTLGIYRIVWIVGGECVVRSLVNGAIVDTYRAGAWTDNGRLPDRVRDAAMAARPAGKQYADDYSDKTAFTKGDRVELHPGCDLWARGAKFGTVHSTAGAVVVVRMDNRSVRKLQYLTADRLRHVR